MPTFNISPQPLTPLKPDALEAAKTKKGEKEKEREREKEKEKGKGKGKEGEREGADDVDPPATTSRLTATIQTQSLDNTASDESFQSMEKETDADE